jgi:uncharacterized protein YggE
MLAMAALAGALGCKARGSSVAPDPEQGLSVTGVGESLGVPDEAKLSLGVQRRAIDAATATAETSAAMERIIAALVSNGVARDNIRTLQISIYEDRRYEPRPMEGPDGKGAGETIEFVATNMLEVRVTDLDAIGKILGAASKAGVNQMHGIELEVGDPSSLEQQALDDALDDARAKAKLLAASSGVKLGPIVAIRVGTAGGSGPPIPLAAARDMDAASVPVERGQVTMHQQVWVKYAIEE